MSIPSNKTFLLVTSSRSSVKVRYQGYSFQKNGHCGGISVSQTHSLSLLFHNVVNPIKDKITILAIFFVLSFAWKEYYAECWLNKKSRKAGMGAPFTTMFLKCFHLEGS